MTVEFRSRLVRPEGVGTWTFAPIPAAAIRRGGFRPRQRVRGTIDGEPFASSLLPRGGGSLFVVVNAEVRARLGREAGQSVTLRIELDPRPVRLPIPADLRRALAADETARTYFAGLAPSHRKAFLTWIGSAKQAKTRARRLAGTMDLLRRRQKLP